MSVSLVTIVRNWIGYSYEVKPTGQPQGSTFYEGDTGQYYTFFSGTWYPADGIFKIPWAVQSVVETDVGSAVIGAICCSVTETIVDTDVGNQPLFFYWVSGVDTIKETDVGSAIIGAILCSAFESITETDIVNRSVV